MGDHFFFRPPTDRSPSIARVEAFELAVMDKALSDTVWPDRNNEVTVISLAHDVFSSHITMAVTGANWLSGLLGRYNRVREIGLAHLDLGDDAERIDSTVFRDAVVALANTIETHGYPDAIYLNGCDGLTFGKRMAVSVPLPIEGLASATKGGYIALSRHTIRLLAGIVLANEYRRKHGFNGGELDVVSTIGLDGSFILRVQTPTVRFLLEQAVLVRPFFLEENVTAAFTHEPQVLAEMSTDSVRRAFRDSVRTVFADDKPESRIELEKTLKLDGYTVISAGADGLSLARLKLRDNVTDDSEDWRFSKVRDGSVSSEGASAWQIVHGWVFEFLPLLSERLYVGLTDKRDGPASTPLLFWNDAGLRIAVAAATMYEV